MRLILKNQALDLSKLDPAWSLRSSYIRTDISGKDLSGEDLTDADIIGTPTKYLQAHNVILPEGKTRYLMSRYVDWTGSTIPSDVSDLAHDLVVEVLNQHHAPPGSKAAAHLDWVRDHVAARYDNSWTTAIWWLVNKRGLTRSEVAKVLTLAFDGYPHLMERMRYETERDTLVEKARVQPEDHIKLYGFAEKDANRTWRKSLWDFDSGSTDRYLLARRVEASLDIRFPKMAPWRAWVGQTEPFWLAVASPESLTTDAYNWWGQL